VLAAGFGLAVGCGGDSQSIEEFGGYGNEHPGLERGLGGHVRIELVHLPAGDQTRLEAYFIESADNGVPAFVPFGECGDVRGKTMWPFIALENPVHADVGETVSVTRQDGGQEFTLNQYVDQKDNVGFVQSLLYGGPGQNGMYGMDLTSGATYDIAYDSGDPIEPSEITMPAFLEMLEPYVIGTDETAEFTIGQDATFNWVVPEAHAGEEHTGKREFTFVLFKNATTGVEVMCVPDPDDTTGSFTVPGDVIAGLQPAGVVATGSITHVLGKWGDRRMDLVAIECKNSNYTLVE
jgi:hypothetical protein